MQTAYGGNRWVHVKQWRWISDRPYDNFYSISENEVTLCKHKQWDSGRYEDPQWAYTTQVLNFTTLSNAKLVCYSQVLDFNQSFLQFNRSAKHSSINLQLSTKQKTQRFSCSLPSMQALTTCFWIINCYFWIWTPSRFMENNVRNNCYRSIFIKENLLVFWYLDILSSLYLQASNWRRSVEGLVPQLHNGMDSRYTAWLTQSMQDGKGFIYLYLFVILKEKFTCIVS